MTHVVLILMVFFVGTPGLAHPPQIEVAKAPAGTTVAECQAIGARLVTKARALEGVKDAGFSCVAVVERTLS